MAKTVPLKFPVFLTNIWNIVGETQTVRDLMARAIYCLGFEDEAVLAELNHTLTDDERLELRLSMPRELWPKTWMEEGEENAGQ